MELLDIIDRNGLPTGKVFERGNQLNAGEYYLGVHMYIINSEGNFLIQKRASCKKAYPDVWDLNMGHVLARETSKQGAIREIYEELGVKLNCDELKQVKRFIWEEFNHIIDIWLIHKDIDINKVVLQEEEVSEVKYVSKKELMNLLTDPSENSPVRPDSYINFVKNSL